MNNLYVLGIIFILLFLILTINKKTIKENFYNYCPDALTEDNGKVLLWKNNNILKIFNNIEDYNNFYNFSQNNYATKCKSCDKLSVIKNSILFPSNNAIDKNWFDPNIQPQLRNIEYFSNSIKGYGFKGEFILDGLSKSGTTLIKSTGLDENINAKHLGSGKELSINNITIPQHSHGHYLEFNINNHIDTCHFVVIYKDLGDMPAYHLNFIIYPATSQSNTAGPAIGFYGNANKNGIYRCMPLGSGTPILTFNKIKPIKDAIYIFDFKKNNNGYTYQWINK